MLGENNGKTASPGQFATAAAIVLDQIMTTGCSYYEVIIHLSFLELFLLHFLALINSF